MEVSKRMKKERLSAHHPTHPIAIEYGDSLGYCAMRWDSGCEIELSMSDS